MQTRKNRNIRAVYEAVSETSPEYIHAERFTRSQDIFDCFENLKAETKEYFLALHLDTKNQIICQEVVSVGSLSMSVVHPREVFKTALLSSAAALVFVHNHPSGDPTPSAEDVNLTGRLREGAELLGLRVLDHIIIGSSSYTSFCDRGLL
jgi:DNA repair protein RadC